MNNNKTTIEYVALAAKTRTNRGNARSRLGAALLALLVPLAGLADAEAEPNAAEEWSAAAANRNLAGLTPALLARDAKAAKPFFAFPIARPGLLPDVAEADFEAYFPTLFDDAFLARFTVAAKEKGGSLWEDFGWRGFAAGNGLLWSEDAKKVTGINYESKGERERRAALERAEIGTLAPSLREGVAATKLAFRTEDGQWRGRLDEMADGTLRLALWRLDKSLSGEPDALETVERGADGSGGNGVFRPTHTKKGSPFAGLRVNVIGSDETPPLELLLCEKPDATNAIPATTATWEHLRRQEP